MITTEKIQDIRSYVEKANEIIRMLSGTGAMRPTEYAIALSLAASNIVKACVADGEDKQQVVDDLCKAIRMMCK